MNLKKVVWFIKHKIFHFETWWWYSSIQILMVTKYTAVITNPAVQAPSQKPLVPSNDDKFCCPWTVVKKAKSFKIMWQCHQLLSGFSCCPWNRELQPKRFKLVWRCHQLLSGVLAKGHLLQVSCLSANDKGDKVCILLLSWAAAKKALS